MDLCSFNHEEICYDEVNCPLCARIDEIERLEAEITDLKDQIAELARELKQKGI